MKLGITRKLRTDLYGQRSHRTHWGDSLYDGADEWEDWYAWKPTFAYNATTNRRELVWLETVQRRHIPAIAGTGVSGVDTGYWVHKQKAELA